MAAIDQLRHLPVEEREQQRPDVRAVDVGVGHDDDAVVAQAPDVEILDADAAAERRDHRLDLVAAQHLVEPRLLDVEDLALDRQDGLETAVAALLGRTTGRLTLDDVDLALRRVALLAIGQFSRQAAAVEGAFATHQIARLARRLTRPGGVHGLADDALGHRRRFFEELPEFVVDDGLDDALDLGVPELGLGLALELRLRNLHADDPGETLADVVAADVRVLQVLRQVVLGGVVVDRAGERGTETREVGAAFVGVDVVREGEHQLRVAVVPLQRDLGFDAVLGTAHEDRLVVDVGLVLVQVLDERDDAAVVLELVALAVTLVVERDQNAAVQKRQFTQALGERVEAVVGGLEDLQIGLECDLGAATLRRAGNRQGRHRRAALIRLLVHVAVAPDFEVEPFGERVHHRHANAVQPARHLVCGILELAAGMEHRQYDFGGRTAVGHRIDRNTAPVVHDRDRVVDVDGDVDLVAESGQRLVNRVVDDLVHQMMEPGRSRGSDVHGGPFTHGLEAFKNLDLVGPVIVDRAVKLSRC